MNVLGIDIGSTYTKAILLNEHILDQYILPTRFEPLKAIEEVEQYFEGRYDFAVGTGYGRNLGRFDKTVTEITCHSKGVRFLFPDANTAIDIGGQDSKVICIGPDGGVTDFLMNDKCAAGTGRFLESILRVLDEKLENVDSLTKGVQPCDINSMCAVFAETEVISLIASGVSKPEIIMGIIHSLCKRLVNQQLNRLVYKNKIAFTGGLYRVQTFKNVLGHYAGTDILTSDLSQFAGALGAAIVGFEMKK